MKRKFSSISREFTTAWVLATENFQIVKFQMERGTIFDNFGRRDFPRTSAVI
jgi:hypothetical protein